MSGGGGNSEGSGGGLGGMFSGAVGRANSAVGSVTDSIGGMLGSVPGVPSEYGENYNGGNSMSNGPEGYVAPPPPEQQAPPRATPQPAQQEAANGDGMIFMPAFQPGQQERLAEQIASAFGGTPAQYHKSLGQAHADVQAPIMDEPITRMNEEKLRRLGLMTGGM